MRRTQVGRANGTDADDAYAMFFDRDAWERSSLTKDEFALVKEADEGSRRRRRIQQS
jgi:hypothetical protein